MSLQGLLGPAGTFRCSYTQRDAMLYALGIGCEATEPELKYVYEQHEDHAVFPTFALCLSHRGTDGHDVVAYPPPAVALPPAFASVDPSMVVHAEQQIIFRRPLPVGGAEELLLRAEVVGVHVKRSGTLLTVESTLCDAEGQALVELTQGGFIRGFTDLGADAGGKEHSRSAGTALSDLMQIPPEPTPAAYRQRLVVEHQTTPQQALLFRLSGDYNPLHADQRLAELVGFTRPILHGLCTYGFAARALTSAICRGDAGQLLLLRGRFSSPVFPGDTLSTEIWPEPIPLDPRLDLESLLTPETQARTFMFRTWVGDKIVLDHGVAIVRFPRTGAPEMSALPPSVPSPRSRL